MNRQCAGVAARVSGLPLEPGSMSSCYRALLPVSAGTVRESGRNDEGQG